MNRYTIPTILFQVIGSLIMLMALPVFLFCALPAWLGEKWQPHSKPKPMLCHICAEGNRSEFYATLYREPGMYVCSKCKREFTVDRKPKEGK